MRENNWKRRKTKRSAEEEAAGNATLRMEEGKEQKTASRRRRRRPSKNPERRGDIENRPDATGPRKKIKLRAEVSETKNGLRLRSVLPVRRAAPRDGGEIRRQRQTPNRGEAGKLAERTHHGDAASWLGQEQTGKS